MVSRKSRKIVDFPRLIPFLVDYTNIVPIREWGTVRVCGVFPHLFSSVFGSVFYFIFFCSFVKIFLKMIVTR